MRWPVFFAAALPVVVGCKETPTTVLLRIEAGPGLAAPAELRLSVYSEAGRDLSDERLPRCQASCPAPELPGEVVLYPPGASGSIRVLVRAEAQDDTVLGEGTAKVELRAGQQVRATLVIREGTLPDRDGDGVPDGIDNCPDRPNPAQGPCGGGDGPVDLGPGLDGERVDGPARDREPPCDCALGCEPGTSTCYEILPSGGFTATSYDTIPSINSSVTLDTDDCELTVGWTTVKGGVQDGACVVALTSLSIPPSGTLRGAGSRPLVLLVEQSVSVSGLIDVGASGATPGPGGGKGGVGAAGGPGAAGDGPGGGKVCSCTMAEGDDCGGGGGGFGSVGGDGGEEGTPCTVTSTGGSTYGGSLDPLVGGSGGASSGQSTAGAVSGGGAGGGALQISCAGTIQVNGAISAGGGGGLAGTPDAGAGSSVGGGGGGSGGAILLEAADITGKGLVAANGGGGASGGRESCGAGLAGEDGSATLDPARGGLSGGTDCGAGGDGAAGTAPAGAGQSTSATSAGGGGGGGGGLGRIRLNWLNHGATAPLATSGETALGEVQRQ